MALTPSQKSKLRFMLVCDFMNEMNIVKFIETYELDNFAYTIDVYTIEEHLIHKQIISVDTPQRQQQLLLLELGIRVKEETFRGRREAILNSFLLNEEPLVLNHKGFLIDRINILSELEAMYNPNNQANVFRRLNGTLDVNNTGICKALTEEVKSRYDLRQWYNSDEELIYQFGFQFTKWNDFEFYTSKACKNIYWYKNREERYQAICKMLKFYELILCFKNWD